MAQRRDIKYVDRDFDNLRDQLVQFTKNYFSDTYNDFSPTSPGMMFMEMVSYVGDVLSFYQDTQLQETFIQHAKDPKNLRNLAYMLGYRPKITATSRADIQVTQIIPADPSDRYKPLWSEAVRIDQNSEISTGGSLTSPSFFLERAVDFRFSSSFDPTSVSVETVDTSFTPLTYALTKNCPAFSGQIKTYTYIVGSPVPFDTVTISDNNIVGILDIVEDNGLGESWYEVPFLGQETIFQEEVNLASDNNLVSHVLKLKKVPKRFTTRLNQAGNLIVQFGSGVVPEEDTTFTPNMTNVGLGLNSGGINRKDFAYDPSNFLYTRTYGLAPSNTSLRIRYIVGGGVESNVLSNTITIPASVSLSSSDPDILDTISFNNPYPAYGGSDGDGLEDIRQNSLRSFNEQNRVVTLEDFVVRCYSLPATLGSVAKVYAMQDLIKNPRIVSDRIIDSNPLSLSLYVLSYDNEGKLTYPSPTLNSNLKNYLSQFLMLTDSVNIKAPFIVNIGVDYEIIAYPDQVGREVLLRCNEALSSYFNIVNWNINQPLNISEIYVLLDRVNGVQTVQSVKFNNKVGGVYSPYAYDLEGATKGNIIYPSVDPCIFEMKYPGVDIRGRLTNI